MAGVAVAGKSGEHATSLALVETRTALRALRPARSEDAAQETCRLVGFYDRRTVRRTGPRRGRP
jgi:hypothetical protein